MLKSLKNAWLADRQSFATMPERERVWSEYQPAIEVWCRRAAQKTEPLDFLLAHLEDVVCVECLRQPDLVRRALAGDRLWMTRLMPMAAITAKSAPYKTWARQSRIEADALVNMAYCHLVAWDVHTKKGPRTPAMAKYDPQFCPKGGETMPFATPMTFASFVLKRYYHQVLRRNARPNIPRKEGVYLPPADHALLAERLMAVILASEDRLPQQRLRLAVLALGRYQLATLLDDAGWRKRFISYLIRPRDISLPVEPEAEAEAEPSFDPDERRLVIKALYDLWSEGYESCRLWAYILCMKEYPQKDVAATVQKSDAWVTQNKQRVSLELHARVVGDTEKTPPARARRRAEVF